MFSDDYDGGDFRKRIRALPLPDHIRREMRELGFPGDGYNCLREIKVRVLSIPFTPPLGS